MVPGIECWGGSADLVGWRLVPKLDLVPHPKSLFGRGESGATVGKGWLRDTLRYSAPCLPHTIAFRD